MAGEEPFVYAEPYRLPDPFPGHMDKKTATHHDMRSKLYYVIPQQDEEKFARDIIGCYLRRRYKGFCEHVDSSRPNRFSFVVNPKP